MKDSSELYRKARQKMEQGKTQDAVELFQQSIAISPHFKSLELLGECFISLNRLTEAIVPLAAATALNKSNRAPALLSEVFLKLNQHHQAREMAKIALSRDSQNRKALEVKRLSIEIVGDE